MPSQFMRDGDSMAEFIVDGDIVILIKTKQNQKVEKFCDRASWMDSELKFWEDL